MKERERIGIGIPWLWQLPDDHRFFKAAVYHDAAYYIRNGEEELFQKLILKIENPDFVLDPHKYSQSKIEAREDTSLFCDITFLLDCYELAGSSRWLKFLAHFFFIIIRIWGSVSWGNGK